MKKTRRTRAFAGVVGVVFAAVLTLVACEPGDRVPILRSAVVQSDQVTIQLSWPAVTQTVTSYEIWYRPTGTTTWLWSSTGDVGENYRSWVPVVAGTTEYVRSFRATGITAGGTYDVSVRSVAADNSVSSLDDAASKATVTMRSPTPTPSVTSNSVTITWPSTTYSPFVRWEFYFAQGSATPTNTSSSTTMSQTSKTFTGLQPSTSYTVGLRAVQSDGQTINNATYGTVSSVVRLVTVTTASDWNLTFSDEFNDGSLDTSKWNVVTGGIGNYYSCMAAANVVESGTTLKMIAKNQTATCNGGQSLPYTGSYIQTRSTTGNFNQAYGRFEFRAKMPSGKGLWPGLWLTNTSGASAGELDVFEEIGIDPTQWTSTLHYYPQPANNHLQAGYAGTTTPSVDLSAAMHTYSVEWTPCRIATMLDGVVQKEWTSWFPSQATMPDPFDANGPMHIRIDNKIGARDTTTGVLKPAMRADNLADPNTPFATDRVLELDWVRVYAKSSYTLPSGCPNL